MRRLASSLIASMVLAAFAPAPGGHVAFAASASAPPYTDANVVGSVGLCDGSGHNISEGKVAATPFVWSAVSSQGPPRGYDGAGRTATLLAFQPRQGAAPGEWSGQLMTSSARYSNPAHPMAAATGGDASLADFLSTFPASWDGYLELRLYVGAPNEPQFTQTYAATDIRVDGDTWRVVRGGSGPCGSGTAESLESRVLPRSLTDPSTTAIPKASRSSRRAISTIVPNKIGNMANASADQERVPTTRTEPNGSGPASRQGVEIVVLLLVACGGTVLLIRGRSRSSRPTPEQ